MEGFVKIKLRPYLRRLITRVIALLPAVAVISISGDEGTYQLLILSQVILSLQLPFAIVPLVHFTSDKLKMGAFTSKLWVKVLAWITSVVIIVLNGKLVYDQILEWVKGDAPLMVSILAVGCSAALALFLRITSYNVCYTKLLRAFFALSSLRSFKTASTFPFDTFCSRVSTQAVRDFFV